MKYLLLFCIALSFGSIAQKKLINETSVELITKAYNFQQDSEFERAIEEYEKVSINDTNYAIARYEMGTCYMELEKYDEAKEVLRSLIDDEIKFDFQQDVYSSLGLAYGRGGDSIGALKVFNEGIAKYPMDFRLYYNRAITHETMENYQLAVEDYKNSIQRNIYFAPAHLRLGVMAANEEHYAEATMSLITYFMLDPTGDKATAVVSLLEEIADGSFNPEPKNIQISATNPFEAINLLFKNRVALEKKYKTKFTVPTAYGKQLHFVASNATYSAEDLDFWNQMYLPIYQQILQGNKLDQLVMLSLIMVEAPSIQKKLKSKIKSITDFIEWVKPVYNTHLSNQYFVYEGAVKKVYMEYEDKKLNYFGPLDEDGQAHGNFYYYHGNGSMMLKAVFEHGEPVGTYEFYNATNDKIFKKLTFETGDKKIEELFYYSGELSERSTTIEKVLQDTLFLFYRNGSIKETISVKDGKRDGKDTYYYANGKVKYYGHYKDGKAEGEFKNYHRNGNVEAEFTYVNDLMEGKRTRYYPDGTIESVYNLKEDKYDGPYEEFYPNGKLSEKGTYKNGVSVGELTYYYSNGNVKNSITLDENGKENGKSILYDLDGKKYHEIDFASGDIKEIRYFDKSGKMEVLAQKKGKKMNYLLNYPDGKLYASGKFDDGKRDGVWMYYDRYGNISKKETYKNGMVTDTLFTYHPNGKVHKVINYKDGYMDGIYLEYSIYGDLIEEGFYKEDELDREWYSYYANGTLENEYYYMNSDLHGFQKSYSINGKLENIEEYDNGLEINHIYLDTNGVIIDRVGEYNGEIKLHDPTKTYINFVGNYLNGENNGAMTFYGPNNTPLTKGNFENNLRKGKWLWYYPDGKLREEGTYVNGDLHGPNTEYFKNGKPEYTCTFEYGLQQGDFKLYYENGKLKLEGTLLDGERHGRVTTYSPDGSVILIRNYNDGVIEEYSYLGTDGKAVPFIPLTKESDSIVTYHKNGKIAIKSKRVSGLLEGAYLTYYENGQLFESENFWHDKNHGMAKAYYSDGKLMTECNYIKGEKDGVEKFYHPNGKLRSEQTFVMGTAHGELKEYSADGKLISITVFYDNEILSVKKF